jgi:glycerol uptake facilitator-like aquaporin
MFVILGVSTGARQKGITAGIVAGSVIALEAMFAGPITGASMNPARSLGPAVFQDISRTSGFTSPDQFWERLCASSAAAAFENEVAAPQPLSISSLAPDNLSRRRPCVS